MQQRVDRLLDAGRGLERRELRQHGGGDRYAARHRAQPDHLRLGGCGEINEDRDEDQQRIAEQADEAEAERDPLADGGRDLGGAHVTEPGRQQRAQYPAAVHRKRRDEVEHGEEQVDGGQPIDEVDAPAFDRVKMRRIEMRARERHEHQRDHDVDGRARDRDQEFLAGLFRNAGEPRHAADRQ